MAISQGTLLNTIQRKKGNPFWNGEAWRDGTPFARVSAEFKITRTRAPIYTMGRLDPDRWVEGRSETGEFFGVEEPDLFRYPFDLYVMIFGTRCHIQSCSITQYNPKTLQVYDREGNLIRLKVYDYSYSAYKLIRFPTDIKEALFDVPYEPATDKEGWVPGNKLRIK